MAAPWRSRGMPFIFSGGGERSVVDELALLHDLAASRRIASFKALMIRHRRSLRSATNTATLLLPSEFPAPDTPAVDRAYIVRMRTDP
jgi:hypothetical protein